MYVSEVDDSNVVCHGWLVYHNSATLHQLFREEGESGCFKSLSWQIIPSILSKLLTDPDPVKAQRVMMAMLQMKKIESAKLQQAYKGK